MLELSQEEAISNVNSGHSGFYSYRCQAPIAHIRETVVFADNRWFLLGAKEFLVRDHGLATHPDDTNIWFRKHDVLIEPDDHPIIGLLLKDAEADKGPATERPVVDLIDRLREMEKQT